jgi:hypothetical protein
LGTVANGKNVVAVNLYNYCHMFAGSGPINYVVTGKNLLNSNAIAVFNPKL